MVPGGATLALLVVLGSGVSTTVADEPPAGPALGDAQAIAEGRRIYRTRCVICHGKAGGRGPNLFATRLSDEAFLEIVINGRKGALMPAFGLTLGPDEVSWVRAYVQSTDHYK